MNPCAECAAKDRKIAELRARNDELLRKVANITDELVIAREALDARPEPPPALVPSAG